MHWKGAGVFPAPMPNQSTPTTTVELTDVATRGSASRAGWTSKWQGAVEESTPRGPQGR